MEVKIINRGPDGEKMCFLLQDIDGNQYEITNCDLTDIRYLDVVESYMGSFIDENGTNHIAYLKIYKINKKIELEL